jgi:hypothetical protein
MINTFQDTCANFHDLPSFKLEVYRYAVQGGYAPLAVKWADLSLHDRKRKALTDPAGLDNKQVWINTIVRALAGNVFSILQINKVHKASNIFVEADLPLALNILLPG